MDLQALKSLVEEGIPFVKKTGVRLLEAGEEGALLSLPENPENLNPLGILHAGATFTLAETAGAAACLLALPLEQVRFVGKEINIRFRRPGRGEVTCRASLDSAAAEQAVAAARAGEKPDLTLPMEIVDGEGTVICQVEATYAVRALG